MLKNLLLLSCTLATLMAACRSSSDQDTLRSADLIFVAAASEGLGDAINSVTQTERATDYIHMGILERNDDMLMVIHADNPEGVKRESVAEFIRHYPNSYAYRVTGLDRVSAKEAITIAKSHLGEPYNYSYILQDEGMYCSELVYKSYHDAEVFSVNPMTFKAGPDSAFHPFWVQYYDSLNIPIPEGELGCNPNGMANNPRLKLLGRLDAKGSIMRQ